MYLCCSGGYRSIGYGRGSREFRCVDQRYHSSF